jgi:hypothetical protein
MEIGPEFDMLRPDRAGSTFGERMISYMRNSAVCLKRIGMVMAITFAGTLLMQAQAGPANMEGKTAEQVYKNIKVLTGTPADQLNPAMHLIRAALGVDCEFCHEETNRAADTKRPKDIARKMMQMMMDINKTSFNGRQQVTCDTCHRGSPDPENMPMLPLADQAEAPQVPLPSVDQLLAKYVEALGGEQAIRKVTSRVITGTQFIPTGPGGAVPVPAAIERDVKAPNLIVNIYKTPTYTISDGFDGTVAWSQDARGRVLEAGKLEQGRAKRGDDFYEPLNLKGEFTQMQVRGIERVNDRDAYVVVGRPQGDSPERLYFDTETGLLLRRSSVLPTPVGNIPLQVNYADYRDTGSGVKYPYLITLDPASADAVLTVEATIRVTKVQDNAPVDDSKFAKPAPKAPAGQ